MANTKRVQIRRGTSAEHSVFTGAVGEVTYDTDKKTLISHDGSTAGGTELARADFNNVAAGASTPGSVVIGEDLTIQGDISIDGNSHTVGIATFGSDAVVIGGGNTTIVVNGNARFTGTVSVGSSTVIIDGLNDSIYAPKAVFDNVTFTGNDLKTFTLNTTVSKTVGIGSTGIVLSSTAGVSTGDKITIQNILDKVSILDITNVPVDPFNVEYTSTIISTTVSAGSSIIAVGSTSGVSIGDSITVYANDGFIRAGESLGTSRIVGITTVPLQTYYNTILSSTTAAAVSSGSTIIGSNSIAGITVGDTISITGALTNINIVGFSSVSVPPYNIGVNTVTTSSLTAAGSTIIGVANTNFISVGSSITISGVLDTEPIVEIGQTVVSFTYNQVLDTLTNALVEANSTTIFVNSTVGVETGSYVEYVFSDAIEGSISNGGTSYTNGVYSSVDILNTPSATYTVTVSGAEYYLNGSQKPALTLDYGRTYRFDMSDASNSGHPLVFTSVPNGVGYISKGTAGTAGAFVDLYLSKNARTSDVFNYECSVHGASYGNTITVGVSTSGYSGNGATANVTVSGGSVSNVVISSHGVNYKIGDLLQIYSGDVGGTGSGFQYTVSGIVTAANLAKIQTTAVGSTSFTVAGGDALPSSISVGSTVIFSTRLNNLGPAVFIGSGIGQTVSAGTTAVFTNVSTTKDAVLIASGDTYAGTIPSGSAITYQRLIQPASDAVIIAAGSTVGYGLTTGNIVGFSSLVTEEVGILIGAANTSSGEIPVGTNVSIDRFVPSYSEASFDNLSVSTNTNLSGITTIEKAIISGLNYPLADGLKGQVLVTDGAGNVAFGTGGGSGGSEVILRVSSKTGSDDNDGKILPLRTIKKAAQLASKVGKPVTIFVETGEYVEDNPIIVYDSVSIIGDSLRNIIVRPLNAGKDLIKVRNGCYISGMSFNDYVDSLGVPQHTYDYSIAFDDPYDTTVNRTGYAAIYAALDIVGATYDTATGFTTFTTASAHELAREYSVRLTGIGWTCGYDEIGISTFVYDNVSGVSTITFFSDSLFTPSGSGNTQKGYVIGDKLFLDNLPFSCGAEHAGVTTTIFPDGTSQYGRVFTITGINTAAKTATFNAGVSTIPHIYEGWPTVAISTFSYDHVSGIATATTSTPHGFLANDRISLQGLEFSCVSGAGTTTIFPDGTVTAYSPDGYTFKVSAATTSTFTYNVGVSTLAHDYVTGGTVQKVPTVQEVWYYPDYHKDGQTEFGVVSSGSSTVFTIRGQVSPIQHYYTQGGTLRLTRPIINKSPYIQNCSILSSLGGNGILVDGDKVAGINKPIVPQLGEIPVVGDQPEFGKSMVAATFTMISFGGIGWRTINDGYAQVVSCFQIFCRYGSLTQSGGYLSITNSATNFGDKALRSTGFRTKAFPFDKGTVVANGTQDGLQTLTAVGYGRSDQELYVCRFIDKLNVDRTALFKPLVEFEEFNSSNINTTTNVFNIPAHPFVNGESIVYNGNEDASPPSVLDGLVNDASYYVEYIDASNFRLYEDEGLRTVVDIEGTFTGIHTFTKNNQDFFNYEFIETHNSYQKLTLAGSASTANFVTGREVTQGSATGYAITFSQTTRELVVSNEAVGGSRVAFSTASTIADHSASPISVGVSSVVGISTLWTLKFKVESTSRGNLISGINSLTENYQLHLHRPSIINSSSHTWEYSGSGTDYNALPQNGGQGRPDSEQVSELGGRVYASGTNELGDFKIGSQITAYNRTGNIIFNNKVTIGELASIRLSLSGGVAVEEFSTDTGLGDNETGGPQNSRVSTQLAVKSFLSNRLGSFIDKQVSTNAIPNAVVQLNAQGQINADLIPPQVVTYTLTNVGGGRTVLVNQIPAVNIKQGDTIVEPDDSFVLVNDVLSQYLVLDSSILNYTFQNGDVITSALTESVTGIVTTPPAGIGIGTQVFDYVGYGQTGLVKGVLLNLSITNGGSGYSNAGIYTAVTLTTLTGVGQSAYGTITIGAGGTATNISAFAGGRGYAVGDIISVSDSLVGGRSGGAQLQATISEVETRLYVELENNQKFAGTIALPDYISDNTAVSISTSLTDDYVVDIDPTDISTGGDIDFTNDRFVVGVGHQFGIGDPIIYDANGGSMISAGGGGILNLNTYYTKPVGVSSVELYYDYSLVNKIDLSGSGIGTHKIKRQVVNISADKLVFVNHGFTTGDPFRVFGATPTGITTHEFYYIGAVTENAFTLHETQADSILATNGVSFNPVAIAATSVGIMTMTEQNIRYSETVNTSSQSLNNYALLARDSIDASNIVSGIIPSTRLGTGSANNFTFLNGSSEYKKVAVSIGIGTTQPMSATSTSAELAPGGIGVNTYFGNIELRLNRVDDPGIGDYSTLGVAKFKKTTFAIGSDGEIQIKAGSGGDVDANQLQGQGPAFYLSAANHTGSVPITRGGTGLTGAPSDGAILIGNGSAYNLTTAPVFKGKLTISSGLNAWDTTTPGTTTGSLHLGAVSVTADAGPALTFGSRDSGDGLTGMAGIYVRSDSGYGTKMYFGTTDSYVLGSKMAMDIDQNGKVSIGRSDLYVANQAAIETRLTVGSGTVDTAYTLKVDGSFAATTKSFLIDHPTKDGMKLRYGSLEGPENGVYVRGKTTETTIELPEYWVGLVDENTITVTLTPIGEKPVLHSVVEIKDNKVTIASETEIVNCYYVVYGERKDVEKLEVEF